MDYKQLLIGICWFILGHTLVFIQLNGQFKWDWFAKNEHIVALMGLVISFFYIWGTKHVVTGFGGLLWPARFVGFSIGISIYALGVSYLFKQGITAKTIVSLCLAFLLVCIQVLWKTETDQVVGKDKVEVKDNTKTQL
tara:strand:+ start:647 stop:1060 length:414 start_codon:yes stop_codon:yes gene_type:complete